VQQFFSYTVSGLSTAAIYAIAAAGLVLTYTTTGVFNFAHGATSMLAAFSYWTMRFGWNWPAPVAIVVCLAVLAPLFGVILERGVMRHLYEASETTRVVTTISTMLGLVGLAVWVWPPARSRPFRRFFDGDVVTVAGVRIPIHVVITLAVAAVVAVGLWVVLSHTRFGVAMRAVVDDRALVALNGARPHALSMSAWAMGTVLAALSGVLIAPTLKLSALPLTLLVVNAFAAAVIGRLRSLPMTFVGALVLGLATEYFRGYQDHLPGDSKYLTGLIASVPVVILFLVLVLGRSPLRGHTITRFRETVQRPTWSGTLGFSVIVVGTAALLADIFPKGDLFTLGRVWGLAIIALSIVPVVGYTGQIALCQLSFAGVGMVMVQHLGRGGNPLALVAAAAVPALIGLLVALPSFRLSGIYFALSTAAFAVLMDRWIFLMPEFRFLGVNWDLFNGGGLNLRRTRFFGWSMDGNRSFFVYGAVMFGVVALIIVLIRRSNYGHRLIALKDSPAACATLGMNTKAAKLGVFALSAGMAGFGGALYGQALQAVTPESVQFLSSLTLIMVMVVAGLSSPGAALFAGAFLGFGLNDVVFGKIADLIPDRVGWAVSFFDSLGSNTLILVGLAGVALVRHPDGVVATYMRPLWDRVVSRQRALVIIGVGLAIAYLLRVFDLISNWPYAIVTLFILAVGPRVLGEPPIPRAPGVGGEREEVLIRADARGR
jgi:branched-chain amino acid transport system permease protein